jgi:hypothetical protein
MTSACPSISLPLFLVLSIATVGCGGDRKAPTEVQRVTAGSLNVVLLSAGEGLQHGKDTFVIEFRAASGGALVDVGTVRATATMPMPGASPMFATIDVTRTGTPGRYAAASQFDMAGTWRATLEWDGPQGKGSVAFAGSVQ